MEIDAGEDGEDGESCGDGEDEFLLRGHVMDV